MRPLSPVHAGVDDLLREMDRDGSGSVDFEEFRAAMLQEAPKSAARARALPAAAQVSSYCNISFRLLAWQIWLYLLL